MSLEGLVMKSTGSWYEIKTSEGSFCRCRLRGKLKLKGMKITNPVAVGDIVKYELEKEGQGIISEINPRKNYLIRKSTRKTGHGHIIASNIDQAVLIVSLIFPRTSIGFIDRYLVSAESFRIPAGIIFNKADLLNDPLREFHQYLSKIYDDLGYKNILISAKDDTNLDSLNDWFADKKTLISGHSGVGKSTILNRLKPGLKLPTDEVSTFANKGKHTTTFATMIEMSKDTYIIDTPGIKELGLIDMESWEISHYFPEMRNKFGECKYHNCLHINEPGCAVIEAVNDESISDTRYDSYLSMVMDYDNRR